MKASPLRHPVGPARRRRARFTLAADGLQGPAVPCSGLGERPARRTARAAMHPADQPATVVHRPVRLTPRERDCLRWCGQGKTNWEIGRILGLSERTVEHYLARANRKLGTTSRTQAVERALELDLI